MNCRHCGAPLSLSFLDLGSSPPSNAYLTAETLRQPELWLPLQVLICTHCWLAQTLDSSRPDSLFSPDYAYFSSFSDTWLAHAEKYAHEMINRFSLDATSKVIEVAANDGYLLQYFQTASISCLGIEPTAGTAQAARRKGIAIIEDFFSESLAATLAHDGWAADLLTANNVLAHVPDINDFVSGFSKLLKPQGVATFEFPHLLRLILDCQFDTVYHEHYSYLSLTAVNAIFLTNGLSIFEVEVLSTHGGSLRVYAQRLDTGKKIRTENVEYLLAEEKSVGMTTASFYSQLQNHAVRIKNDLLRFLLDAQAKGQSVAAYGAAAKGNTLLNFAGIRPDLLSYVADRNPAKQGKYLPGSRIPIVDEKYLKDQKPDWILILPWNLRGEITRQLHYIDNWGGKFVIALPNLTVLPG